MSASADAQLASKELCLWWAPIPGTPQEQFFDDDTPDAKLLFRGGWGSGKSMTLWAKVLKLSALNAPLSGIWVVPDYPHVEDTLLPLLEEEDEDAARPWFLGTDYHYNLRTHTLTWAGGGPIVFRSGENPRAIAGPNMAWAAVDEPGSIPYLAWRNAKARVRHARARLRQTVCAGTNEDLGWLAEAFGPDREPDHHVYQMRTAENTELLARHPGYLEAMRAGLTEREAEAYLGGGITLTTGDLAYPDFDADRDWGPCDGPDPDAPLVTAWDFNVDPLMVVVGQERPGPGGMGPTVLDTVAVRGGATVDAACDVLLERFPTWPRGWDIHGDATGRSRHPSSRLTNYAIIEQRLAASGPVRMRVPRANPPVSTRLTSVNRAFRERRAYLRLTTARRRECRVRELVYSLQQTQRRKGSSDIHKPSGESHTHASDAFGYWVTARWPASSLRPAIISTPAPSEQRRVSLIESRRRRHGLSR